MEKTYNPSQIEKKIYKSWESKNCFAPQNPELNNSYTIVLPPPNVTGSLHMGHAFQQTIMDILIRTSRMRGNNTLWQVGTDHAGIATQMLVERKVAKEGKDKHDFGREKFIEKIWEWKNESGNLISNQMKRLGLSADWSREKFTMDEDLSLAVTTAFEKLYDDKLIYRGKRLVNWDPKLNTAISDLEVENRESQGYMWDIKYKLTGDTKTIEGLDYIIVSTTRPETLLGDVAVAVNPNDERYKSIIGKHVMLPIINREIPIIADEHADLDKGTGCVKITPAHDFNDYSVGQKHQLPLINVMTFSAKIRNKPEIFHFNGKIYDDFSIEIPSRYQGLDRFDARKEILSELQDLSLLVNQKDHSLTIPYGDRSGVIIEPLLTNQWYVKTKPLAKTAIDAVTNNEINFVPKQYENMYFSWMNEIEDWCISRQLWWGHRIPAWYDSTGNIYVGKNELFVRKKYKLDNKLELYQDQDVLDTWFSSALWTFASQGWPEKTKNLELYHPTNVLVTGYDIIFFWVARMIMMTMYLVKDENNKPQIPFKTVYVHGLIRDENGQKMSKSKGNVLDPIDMIDGIELDDLVDKRTSNMMQPSLAKKIEKNTLKAFPNGIASYGTDALRFTLASLASTGRDIIWDMNRLEGYRNFCNKLWNASRFLIFNINKNPNYEAVELVDLSLPDRWIKSLFNSTVKEVNNHIDNYRFDLAAQSIYEFTWNQFCDWYLELSKPTLNSNNENKKNATFCTLLQTLDGVLRLSHPFIPFITEEIWSNIKKFLPNSQTNTIMLSKYPEFDPCLNDFSATKEMEWIKSFVQVTRNIRNEYKISLNKKLNVFLYFDDNSEKNVFIKNELLLKTISNLDMVTIQENKSNSSIKLSSTYLINTSELTIDASSLINKDEEISRLTKEISKLLEEISRVDKKLSNNAFVDKAPEHVINKEEKKKKEFTSQLNKLREKKLILEKI